MQASSSLQPTALGQLARLGAVAAILLLSACPPRPAPLVVAPPEELRIQHPFPCGVAVRVLCGYGPTCAQAHTRTRDPRKTNEHFAVDLVRDEPTNGFGKEVVAVASGVVLIAGWSRGGWAPYGKMVYIEHDVRDPAGHRYQSLYAHLHRVTVHAGERVAAGTVIGTLGGSSGATLGRYSPHLHFAMYQDARPTLGGGRAWRPEPMGGYRELHTGMRMVSCGSPDAP